MPIGFTTNARRAFLSLPVSKTFFLFAKGVVLSTMVSKRTTKRSSDSRSTKKRARSDYVAVPKQVAHTSSPDEKRFLDISAGAVYLSTSGIVVPTLCPLSQGSGQGQRTGSKAIIKNVNVMVSFHLDRATIQNPTTGSATVRMILGIDTQCRGTAPNVADVLNIIPTGPTNVEGVLNVISFRNYIIANRFRILKDKIFNLNAAGSSNNGTLGGVTMEYEKFVKVSKKLNLRIDFTNGTGATDVSNIDGNNLFILFIADGPDTAGANGKVFVNFVSRVKYIG